MVSVAKKRGQASTEFLMTYGWALIGLGIVIAALVLTFSWRPEDSIPDSCTFTDSFHCVDAKLNDQGVLNVSLRNTVGSAINVTKFLCTVENETLTSELGMIVQSGETFYVDCTLNTPYLPGEKVRLVPEVEYVKESRSFPTTSEGNIVATVS